MKTVSTQNKLLQHIDELEKQVKAIKEMLEKQQD